MFSGSIVALITPMDERGNIDKKSLKKLVKYHIKNDTHAIVIAGTTGEMSTLSYKERYNVTMLALEFSNKLIPIIASNGSNSTKEAILLTQSFENSGVIGCLSVTPYYNQPNQNGLFYHFKSIANSTNLPQILYNIPKRTGCDLLPSTILKLTKESKNIIGIKESTKNLNRVIKLKKILKKDFILLSGNDETAFDFMKLGGKGVVSVTANIAAKEMVQLCDLTFKGNFSQAFELNKNLMSLHKKLFLEPNPIAIKWACKEIGLIKTDMIRLPMTVFSEKNKKILRKSIEIANLDYLQFL